MTFKDFLKKEGISEADFKEKTVEEVQALEAKFVDSLNGELKELQDKLDANPNKEELVSISKSITDQTDAIKAFQIEKMDSFTQEMKELKDGLAKSQKDLEDANGEITSLKEKGTKDQIEKLQFDKATLENIQKSLDDAQNRAFDFEVKALVFSNTAVTDNVNSSFREAGLDDIAHRKITLLDIFKRVTLPGDHGGEVTWREWDEATTSAVVTAIEEGAAFPEMTVKWIDKSAKLKKIGTSIPVTEEFGSDEATLYNELEDFMRDYVTLFEEEQIFKGTNATGQLNGYNTQAPAYVPAAEGVQAANIFDLCLSVKADISRGKGSRLMADTIVMNLGTINTFLRNKATDNQYVWAPWVVVNGENISIAGMNVVESNLVDDNAMDVFDSTKGTIFEGDSYSFTTGHVNNQFMEDEKTLKGRKRMLLRIKSNDLQAFRKVTDISAALTAIAV